jgi:hypothetical protein
MTALLAATASCAAAQKPDAPNADAPKAEAPGRYFAVQVVDDATGRGVPLVELKTTSNLSFYTDSNGVVALDEPGFMGRQVFFHVRSHGYEFPKDGFDNRGARLDVSPGGRATLKIRRLNIAERLYRVTGEGIYRDSVLAGGFPVPIRQPLLNGEVVGQDTVQAEVYRGKIHWLWGDTNRQRYPLGQFATSGATSELPGKGGLDPAVGVDLNYFVDNEGFSRPMFEPVGGQLKWADAMMLLPDKDGRQRLVAMCTRLRKLDDVIDRTICVFDDEAGRYVPMRTLAPEERLYPRGHPLRVEVNGTRFYYFTTPLPSIRVKADLASVLDPADYEAYTCLPAGGKFDGDSTVLERDADGRLAWAWKRDTDAIDLRRQGRLIRAGKIKQEEARNRLIDVETKQPVYPQGGSVYYNAYRKRYVMIFVELWGKPSGLGEIWYAESEQPEGPWHWARKVVTHDRYSLYNPKHHSFFDQDGGRVIYFEGTYTTAFSRNDGQTPRYEYNQIMYRLDLSDPRLQLPPAP